MVKDQELRSQKKGSRKSSVILKKANTKLRTLMSISTPVNRRRNEMLGQMSLPFFTLSSYDFRLNPAFRDHFVGEVSLQYLKKYKEDENGEYADAKNAAKGFFSLINFNDPEENQEKNDRAEYDQMRENGI
jgi:hypothetical protein